MKTEENQYVKSTKSMLLTSLLVLILLLVVAPFSKHASETQMIQARQRAEILGLQLSQVYESRLNAIKDRSPASAEDNYDDLKGQGYIGQDPWGQPYRYNILRTDRGIARVVILSGGPQGAEESSQAETLAEASPIKVVISPSE